MKKLKKHLSISAAREGIICAFDNGQIVNFQDNFKYMGDVPFTVYFNFETTTGSSVFLDPKMYVISYCQIYSFHPSVNLDKVVIFRSFQQAADEIYDISHFKQEHVPFFNKTTFYQLKDGASAELAPESNIFHCIVFCRSGFCCRRFKWMVFKNHKNKTFWE